MRTTALLALALLLPGCTLVPAAEGPRDVVGPTDGYNPTASFLKVMVRENGGNITLVDFDRRDWAVSEIADRIDSKNVTFLSVHGQPRDILGEVLVQDVRAPADLSSLSYQNMRATAEQRSFYDAAYDRLLQRAAASAGAPSVTTPVISAPALGQP